MPLECRELEKTFLHAYVDGEFSADESAEMKAHLAGCAICAETVRVQQSYKVAAGRANVAAPHQLHDAVRGSLAAEPYRGRWARALREPRAVAVAAATVGAAAWFLAGGLQHPIFRGGHSIVDDGVALHARARVREPRPTNPCQSPPPRRDARRCRRRRSVFLRRPRPPR